MGFSVVTTALSAAENYDLTDLATGKDDLGISAGNTSDDTWLQRAISQVSRAIATYTKRVLVPEVVRDVFDIEQDPYPYQTPGGVSALVLTRWPVIVVQSVVQTTSFGTTQELVEGTDFRTNPATGELIRLNRLTGVATAWEAVPVTVVYMAGFGSWASQTSIVPGPPYQVTVSQAAAFSCDQSVKYANGTALTRVTGAPTAGQYSATSGIYTFGVADAGQSMTITYGVKAVPDDLIEICLRLLTARFHAKGRDPSLVQRETPGIGIERWWFGGAPGQNGPFPPDIAAAIDPYCTKVVV